MTSDGQLLGSAMHTLLCHIWRSTRHDSLQHKHRTLPHLSLNHVVQDRCAEKCGTKINVMSIGAVALLQTNTLMSVPTLCPSSSLTRPPSTTRVWQLWWQALPPGWPQLLQRMAPAMSATSC